MSSARALKARRARDVEQEFPEAHPTSAAGCCNRPGTAAGRDAWRRASESSRGSNGLPT